MTNAISGCTGTDFVSNGGRPATADVLLDGASITNFEPNGGITQISYTPSVESVEEFQGAAVELQRRVWVSRVVRSST